jgi:hypothetical protein
MTPAPNPTELFAASLATCVAFYAGRYLDRHGHRPPRPRLLLPAQLCGHGHQLPVSVGQTAGAVPDHPGDRR